MTGRASGEGGMAVGLRNETREATSAQRSLARAGSAVAREHPAGTIAPPSPLPMPLPAHDSPAGLRHVGISFGRVAHWYDGLGEFSQRLGSELAARAPELRARDGIALHYHLPLQWHGRFGADIGYLDLHTLQRFVHWRRQQFALWHTLHQHIRLRAPFA